MWCALIVVLNDSFEPEIVRMCSIDTDPAVSADAFEEYTKRRLIVYTSAR